VVEAAERSSARVKRETDGAERRGERDCWRMGIYLLELDVGREVDQMIAEDT